MPGEGYCNSKSSQTEARSVSQNELKNTRKTSTKSVRICNILSNESRILFKHEGTNVDTGYLNSSVLMTPHFQSRLGRH